jgi:enoyl-CoA hydratase
MTARLPTAVGIRRAREMSMTGDIVDAQGAARIGLVNDVVPHPELRDRALGAARSISEVDPSIVRELKLYTGGSMALRVRRWRSNGELHANGRTARTTRSSPIAGTR